MSQLTPEEHKQIKNKQQELIAQELHHHLQFLYSQAIREAENQQVWANEQITYWTTFISESGKDTTAKKSEAMQRATDMLELAKTKLKKLNRYDYTNFLADPERLFSRFYFDYKHLKEKLIDKN
jgi:hypothetical protein